MIPNDRKCLTRQIIFVLGFISILALAACKSAPIIEVDPYPSLHDLLFPAYQKITIESEQEIFAIGEPVTVFVDKNLERIDDSYSKIEALAAGIFSHSDLNLLYNNDANTIANDTFNNKSANCLSLIIMTYAMADYAGLGVRFQQVKTPELWVRRDGTSVLNRHVNLRLYAKSYSNIILYDQKSYQLDFDRRTQSLGLPVKVIKKQRVAAMFYNNKGADALIKEDLTQAYAYFRRAVTTEPLLVEAWTNLGILYRRAGRLDYAENAYQQALAIDKNDTTTWENLAFIYSLTERADAAEKINIRIKKQRLSNPYYHFMLGEIEYENQQWQRAIAHFRAAVRLNKKQHEFYFALAKSYSQLGDFERSQQFIKRAKKYTRSSDNQLFYQNKLDRLTDLD